MKSGIAIAAIFDVFLYMILGTLNVIFLHNYGAFWGVIVVVADMLLICGVMGKNTGLLIIWMIITMINIVFLFIGWLAVPLIILFGGFCSKMSNGEDKDVEFGFGVKIFPVKAALLATIVVTNIIRINLLSNSGIYNLV